ncbi:M42 family metallopeptidase [Anaerococcus sp. Marseille-P9784]|uniref:M42 family metallopeptidase n=1 Tax=Anaerococcus sp. Marseille-P9784 TaxID=2614127 RepID=UPI00124A31A1|nr:M42 family metallopeptidase [Anaerococcus sp. Marseille-P9784]
MTEQILKYIKDLCETPSPTGYTKRAEKYLMEEFEKMGYKPYQNHKGNVIVPIKEGTENGLLLSAHVDTLGLMVRSIKANGRLRVTALGGYPLAYGEQENVTIITRSGKEYTGVFRINEPAVHGSTDPKEITRDDKNMEVVIDEITNSAEETEKLGISAGDFIAYDPRFRVDNGFVKSRHLDDKASAGVLMALAKDIKENNININRPLYLAFTIYEEVGHGAASGHPQGITDMIAVDMGVVYDDLKTDETKVSICAKDSSGPYNYDLTNELIEEAKANDIDYAIDIYPLYGSDASAAVASANDFRHALVGSGVAASHGYERTHVNGLNGLYKLLKSYISK